MSAILVRTIALALAGLVLLGGSGCSKQSKLSRHVASGDKLAAAGDFKGAESEYREALRLEPDNQRVLGRIGVLVYHQGRPLSAYFLLDGIHASQSDDLEAQLAYGLSCLSLARTSEARLVAKKILEKQPDNEDALLLLADTCVTTRDNEESRRLVENSLPASKNPAGQHVALGALLLGRQEAKAAEQEFRTALDLNPKSSAALAFLGTMAWAANDVTAAREDFRKSAELSDLRSPRRIKYIDFLMKTGALDDASREVARILDTAPDYVPAWSMRMKVAFLQEKYDDSDAAATEVLSRDKANYEALIQRAAIKLVRGNIEGVIEELKRIEGFFPKSPQVKYQLALAQLKAGQPAVAEEYLQQALRLAPNYDEATLQLAEIYLQKGSPGSAVSVLGKLVEKKAVNARALVLLAQAYRAQGDLNRALSIFQGLSKALPKSPDGPYLAGTILAEMGRSDEARAAFEQSVAIAEDYWPAVERLVNLDLAEKKNAAATARVEARLNQTPEALPALLLRAKIRLVSGNTAGAEADLQQAIKLQPKAQYPYLLLARIYYHTDRTADALAKLTTLAAESPTVNVLMQVGMLHGALGHYDAARDAYEKVLALDPAFPPALNNLAVLCSENLGQIDKAFDLAGQAQRATPNDPVVCDTYGWILFRKGQYQRALQFARTAAEKMPTDPEIQYRCGMIEYYLGLLEPARQVFRNVVNSAGASEVAKDAARRLAILDADPAKADAATRALLAQAVQRDPKDPQVLSRLAQLDLLDGRPAAAADRYEAVLKVNARDVPAMLALVDLYYGPLAKPERARELVKAVRESSPHDPQIAGRLGHALFQAREFAAAYPLLQDAVRALPPDPGLLFDVARSEYSMGRVADAEATLQRMLGPDGVAHDDPRAKSLQALISASNQPAGSEPDLEAARAALRTDPQNVPALMIVGLDEKKQGKFKAAAGEFENALKAYPQFFPAMRELAIIYGDQLGDDQKAEDYATKARQSLPDDAELNYQLGAINFRRADYPASLRFLQQSLRQRPDHAETLFFVGMAHFQVKNPIEAKAELQRALDLGLPPQEENEARRVLDTIGRGGG